MAIELEPDERAAVISSLERYLSEQLDERIGNIAAGGLLNFFLQEAGPLVYNRAIAHAQEALQLRVTELDITLHEEPLTYWKTHGRAAVKRR